MSHELTAQCAPLQMPAPAKAVLMALADMQSEANGRAWPSLNKLEEYTCLSRTTVIAAVKTLEASGVVIADRTNPRHTSYKVKPESFQADKAVSFGRKAAPTSAAAALPKTENGGADSAGAALETPLDSTAAALSIVLEAHHAAHEDGAGAAPPSAGAVLDLVRETHHLVREPHPNHKEPKTEPKENHKSESPENSGEGFELLGSAEKTAKSKTTKAARFDAGLIDLPEWLSREIWQSWVADRKERKQALTKRAAKFALADLAEHREAGHTPEAVIENAIRKSWRGLYAPKGQFPPAPRTGLPNRHSGFSLKDPAQGIKEDGTFSIN